SWEAVTDSEEDYFVIERSTNGQNFVVIGTVKGFPPYQFTDEQVESGNNSYRVKQVRTNGASIYSGQVNLMKSIGVLSMVVYPNPVNDQLNIQLNSFKAQSIMIQVTDVFGRIMFTRAVNLKSE